MSIYTRNGDGGMTSLLDVAHVSKDDERILFLGVMDELNAHLGLIKAMASDDEKNSIQMLQKKIMALSSEVAGHPIEALTESDVQDLENQMEAIEKICPHQPGFVVLGESILSAEIHIARTVCRRGETALARIVQTHRISPAIMAFINRLSDYLFAYAAYCAFVEKISAAVREALGYENESRRFLTLDKAKQLIEAVEAEAARQKLSAVIAVVNSQGNPIAVHVMDGAFLISYDAALSKAYTAVAVKMSTAALQPLVQPSQMFYGLENISQGKITAIAGGEPLMYNCELLGGLGVSGGTGEQDGELARWAADCFARQYINTSNI